ncbi:MAG: type II toxin-antitoxin system RelE/ParE family toxin [Candidatus Peregrinibacteria bacterium]|nr:type II toxin-antitoxin system RelE/ParE family toxin [Candidatus Peregrinibacteria bacterium]MCB9807886.1 type II toxin-antitoxin system RelE/ParE family toxin [Candidatus Peribacteria bacterium]
MPTYNIEYSEHFDPKSIRHIAKADRDSIKTAIEHKLTVHPETFGKPLRRSLKGYRRLRVDDYRVIYRIEKTSVKIFAIGHRSTVYEDYMSRFL